VKMTRCMMLTLCFFESMEMVDDSILVEKRITRFLILHWRFEV
jgi:hypothetical protein